MILKDQVKNFVRKTAERRPSSGDLHQAISPRKPLAVRFADDGIVPNHPRWPLIVYRRAIHFPDRHIDPAAVMDAIFELNGWGRSWRDTIYDFLHYHSQIHEVLGVAKGHAQVEFGGIKGRTLELHAGDVAILPAGTGHRLIDASRNFLVVGAYPADGTYDECTDTRDRHQTIKTIAKVSRPKRDPVYGKDGGLATLWTSRPRKR